MNADNLSRRAIRSVLWSVFRTGSDQVFNLIVFATLARLLQPADFGVFVVSLAVAEFGKIIAQGGLVASLYRAKEITPVLADTVFWANLAMGLLVAIISFVLRHPLAAALGSPNSATVIGVIGFVVPIAALGASHMSRNLREFGHRALAIRSLYSGLIGGGLALAAAFSGWGVWSLVVQRFASEAIGSIVAWRAFRWRPGFEFSFQVLREQFGLGVSVATAQAVLVALSRTQDIIISRVMGLAQVGIYRTAWKSIELVAQGVIVPFSAVAEPTLIKLRYDLTVFRRGYVRIIGMSAIVSLPAITGVGMLGDDLIPLLFGSHWGASVAIAKVLSLISLPLMLNYFAEPALTVLGKPKITMYLSFAQLGLTLLICIPLAKYGLLIFAVGYVARTYATMLLQLILVGKATGIRPTSILGAIVRPVVAAGAMAAFLATASHLAPSAADPTVFGRIARLGLFVVSGGAVYGIVLFAIMRSAERDELLGTARQIFARRTATI